MKYNLSRSASETYTLETATVTK